MSGRGAFADAMGVTVREDGQAGGPLLVLPFGEPVEGRPGYLHGGAIASLLEAAALAAVGGDNARLVSFGVDYLRGAARGDTFARGFVTRRGRRVVHVTASAWQDDPVRPIALARMNLVVGQGSG